MSKSLLAVLMFTAIVSLAGCTGEPYSPPQSSSTRGTASQSQTAVAPTPPPPPPRSRVSTTQQLPGGYSYIHRQDLSPGPLNYGSTTQSTVTPAPAQ